MSYRLRSSWLALLALVLLVPLGACNCNGSSSTSAQEDSDQAGEESSAVAADESDQAQQEQDEQGGQEAPPADLYPGMNFGSLSADVRTQFVEIAEAEVCPCPDAAESLHECLQDEATACTLAKQVAGMSVQGIRQGMSETDILDRVAEFVEASRQEHDFELEGVPHKGPEDAPVKIVEFADFECPHCRTASAMLDQLADEYGDDVVIYFKQFPLQSHSNAEVAARASLAAHEQGKFWQMHDLLFEHQRSLSRDRIMRFARRIGINAGRFEDDLNSQAITSKVARDRTEGNQAGITGTPAIFINGRRYMGQNSVQALSQAVEAELAEAQGSETEQAQ